MLRIQSKTIKKDGIVDGLQFTITSPRPITLDLENRIAKIVLREFRWIFRNINFVKSENKFTITGTFKMGVVYSSKKNNRDSLVKRTRLLITRAGKID
jgi:hypothetical protein